MSIPTEKRIAQVTYNGISIPLTKETWVLNQTVNTSTKFSYNKNFIANGVSYSSISVGGSSAPGAGGMVYDLRYGNTTVATSGSFGTTDARNINRKITFNEPAEGGLLTWLEGNGAKQSSDVVVQDTKALTIESDGTVSVTPDAPYDALKKVDVTVDTATNIITFEYTPTKNTFEISHDALVRAGIDTEDKFFKIIGISIFPKSGNADWFYVSYGGTLNKTNFMSQLTYAHSIPNSGNLVFYNQSGSLPYMIALQAAGSGSANVVNVTFIITLLLSK